MPKQIWISSAQLIKTLKITEKELIEIEKFFDSDPNDKWNLEEGRDYKIINRTTGLREYTDTGAYAIASYLEAKHKAENKGFIGWIRDFIRKLKGDVRKVFVREKFLYNSSSLVKRQNRFYLSEKDVIAIFGTKRDYLYKIFELSRREEKPLIADEDYSDSIDEGVRYYSVQGIVKLSYIFSRELTRRNRQEWCGDVGLEAKPFTEEIERHHQKREKRIESAQRKAKSRDGQRCKVTGESRSSSKISPIKLEAHHLYCASEYPHLAESIDNIITIKEEIHDHFHQVMGGKSKPCTVDDFIRYVKDYYPDKLDLMMWLHEQKAKIPSEINKNDLPMVLYLKPERVTQNN